MEGPPVHIVVVVHRIGKLVPTVKEVIRAPSQVGGVENTEDRLQRHIGWGWTRTAAAYTPLLHVLQKAAGICKDHVDTERPRGCEVPHRHDHVGHTDQHYTYSAVINTA